MPAQAPAASDVTATPAICKKPYNAPDAKTGRPCLQLPLPDAETLKRISDVLAALAKSR
jgi:hypothetical protein